MKAFMKRLLLLLPQILYVGIPYFMFAVSVSLYLLESNSISGMGELSDFVSSFLAKYSVLFMGLYFLVAVLNGASSYVFVKEAKTAPYALTSNLICTAALLPIQVFLIGASVLGYILFGSIFSLFGTGGEFDVWKYLPLVLVIILISNAIYSLPTLLHGFFGVLRAYKEKLLTKMQVVLLIIFMLDPLIRIIPVIIAMAVVRTKVKKIAPQLSPFPQP